MTDDVRWTDDKRRPSFTGFPFQSMVLASALTSPLSPFGLLRGKSVTEKKQKIKTTVEVRVYRREPVCQRPTRLILSPRSLSDSIFSFSSIHPLTPSSFPFHFFLPSTSPKSLLFSAILHSTLYFFFLFFFPFAITVICNIRRSEIQGFTLHNPGIQLQGFKASLSR